MYLKFKNRMDFSTTNPHLNDSVNIILDILKETMSNLLKNNSNISEVSGLF